MMILLPKATKTSLAKLVRSKGYELPSIRQAYYTGILGQPVLQVDKDVLD